MHLPTIPDPYELIAWSPERRRQETIVGTDEDTVGRAPTKGFGQKVANSEIEMESLGGLTESRFNSQRMRPGEKQNELG